MYRVDLKGAYFAIPLYSDLQGSNGKGIFQFICLYFVHSPAPKVVRKPSRIPISVMRKLNVRLKYLDDILIMTSTKKELIHTTDFSIFLLRTLGQLIKKQTCYKHPDFPLSRCGNKFQGQYCITFPREHWTKLFLNVQVFWRKNHFP